MGVAAFLVARLCPAIDWHPSQGVPGRPTPGRWMDGQIRLLFCSRPEAQLLDSLTGYSSPAQDLIVEEPVHLVGLTHSHVAAAVEPPLPEVNRRLWPVVQRLLSPYPWPLHNKIHTRNLSEPEPDFKNVYM